MRVLIDTNIIVSAAYSKDSVPYKAFAKAVEPPNTGLLCEQSLEELRRVCNRKFPMKIHVFEHFIAAALPVIEIIPVPPSKHPDEDEIRDMNDRPIYRAAVRAGADIILTGDRDFLDSNLKTPQIMSAAEFLST
jgi:putative PIN family toxin of toxin-antitoxin system